MLKNYLKTAFRNLLREKSSTFINIAGLTLGLTSSLILFLIITYHTSFDHDITKRDKIYRVVNQSNGNQGIEYQSGVPTVLPDAFRLDFPEAEEVVFTSYRSGSLVLIPQRNGAPKKFQEDKGVVYTEPSYFKIFDRVALQGDPVKGLDEPNEAVIAKSLAKKYFDSENVIGEVIRFADQDYKISAIIDDAAPNSDFPFNLMLSYTTIKKVREEDGWNSIWSDEQCYFLLKDDASISSVDSRMDAFSLKYIGKEDPDKTTFFTQPLTEVHFDERFDTYSYSKAPRGLLIFLGAVALVLILTACINFINLSTAEAIKRSKEVGIRKSLGSTRAQLIFQFLGETTCITLVSVLLSVGITQISLSFISNFLSYDLNVVFTGNPMMWGYLAAITVVVSILSGIYPAFIVSGYSPVSVLKNKIGNKSSSSFLLRRTLVVVQFTISQLLIILTIVIIFQVKYFNSKDLGFNKDAIVMVSVESDRVQDGSANSNTIRLLRDEMMQVPGVELASLSSAPPTSGNTSETNFIVKGEPDTYSTQVKLIDNNFVNLYGLKILSGQNVQDLDTTVGFLVNEKFAHIAGNLNASDMVGKTIRIWRKEYPVVGIVQDFHTQNLHESIEPTVMFNRIDGYQVLALKIDQSKATEILNTLKLKWEAAFPDQLYSHQYLDDSIREMYESEEKMYSILVAFTVIAIFIGCLGLFGLATFMANQKTKEIGVRKVLGASVESIVLSFSKEYIKLIVIGFLIAAPVAYLAVGEFLALFQYKIDLSAGFFVLGLVITALIAMVTVSYRSVKAAVANPVQSLRYE
jgi:ABC-type antimicrobial peptide transport system permease subunit